jgi:3'-5' exoribonuclease 1
MKVPGVDALRDALAALSLDTRGHKDVLKKRLRTASKRKERQIDTCKIPKQTRPGSQDFDSYLVLDFEATCQRNEPAHGSFFGFPNEVKLVR